MIINDRAADNEPLSFKTILESSGIFGAVWSLRVLPLKEQALFQADLAESILPYFEADHPNDKTPHKAVKEMRNYHAGKLNLEDLKYFYNTEIENINSSCECAAVAVDYKEGSWDLVEEIFIKHFC